MKKGMNVLVLGNQAGDPITHGSGSGQIAENFIFSPLQAVCDELGVPRIPNWAPFFRRCNKETGNCVSYIGLANTNGKWFGKEETEEGVAKRMATELKDIAMFDFDATLIFQGLQSGEGFDRSTLDWNQAVFRYLRLIPHPGKVIGSMVAPGPILTTNMRKYADAILFNVMPGQQYAYGLMNVMFGRANPSAKLSFTMPNVDNEQNMTQSQFPGDDGGRNSTYSEKHHFGYRWYDQHNVTPAFEFGHGLSYTSFLQSDWSFSASTRTMKLNVTNTGQLAGSEIVQLYVGYPETANVNGGYRSPKVLRGFSKVKDLKPGENREVTIQLDERAFAFWNVAKSAWDTDAGQYKIFVGSSSRDIKFETQIEI